mmetsp:Transcript_25839/g.76947  ORF Transcript_25839/g.76947 Transcript_25839/m.76947 type:complete len:233 (-) Transcript_25839:27-725(-)
MPSCGTTPVSRTRTLTVERLHQLRVLHLVLSHLEEVLPRARLRRRLAQLGHRPPARLGARPLARRPLRRLALPVRRPLPRRLAARRPAGGSCRVLHPAAAAVVQRHHLLGHQPPVLPRVARHRRPDLAPHVVLHVLQRDVDRVLAATRAHRRLLLPRVAPLGRVPPARPRRGDSRRCQPLAEADRPPHRRVQTEGRPLHRHALPRRGLRRQELAQPQAHDPKVRRQRRPVGR